MKTAVLVPEISYAKISPIAETIVQLAEKQPEEKFLLLIPESIKLPAKISSNVQITTFKPQQHSLIKNWLWKKSGLKRLLLRNECDRILLIAPEKYNTGKVAKKDIQYHLRLEHLNAFHDSSTEGSVLPFMFPYESDNKAITEQIYFLTYIHPGNKHLLLPVIKAFSAFKKRMKSGLQLLICADGVQAENIIPNFEQYKYRDDVRFLEADAKLMNSYFHNCLAFIYPATEQDILHPAVHALQEETITITNSNMLTASVFGDHVLPYTGEVNLGNALQDIYKDEQLQSYYKLKAKEYAALYTPYATNFQLR